jgi:hypothetical protein
MDSNTKIEASTADLRTTTETDSIGDDRLNLFTYFNNIFFLFEFCFFKDKSLFKFYYFLY